MQNKSRQQWQIAPAGVSSRKANIMQGNSGFSKIIRTKPQAPRTNAAPARGPKWTRTDKRAAYSQK